MTVRTRSVSSMALTCLLAAALPSQRTFPTRVTLDIGGLLDTPADELTRVTSAVRTADGQIVIGNGKPAEVRVYDAKGQLLRRLGREGSGPGEFRNGTMVRPWTGDSILTLSTGTRRWMLYGLKGALVREWPVDSAHPATFATDLKNWAFIRAGTIGSGGCILPAITRIAAPTPWEPREVVTDNGGRVWVRTSDTGWDVYTNAGGKIGSLSLPARLTILQFSGDLILGHRFDADDAEHVVMVQVSLPPAPAAAPPCQLPPPLSPPERVRSLKITLGNIRVAGEAMRSDTKSYPLTIPGSLVVIPEDVETKVLTATETSFVVLLGDRKSSLRCLFSSGMHGIAGWSGGAIACTD